MPDDENKPVEPLILKITFMRVAVLGAAAFGLTLFFSNILIPNWPGHTPAEDKITAAPGTPAAIKLEDKLRKQMGSIAFLYEGFRPDLENCDNFGALPVLEPQRTYMDAHPDFFENNFTVDPSSRYTYIDPQQYTQVLNAFERMGKMAYARYSELTMSLTAFYDRSLNANEKKEHDAINEEIGRMELIARTVTKTLDDYPGIDKDVKTFSTLKGYDAPSHPAPQKDLH